MLSERNNRASSADGMALVVALGRALHRFGAAVDRVEAAMSELSQRLGLAGEFFVAPTSIHAAFGPTGRQHAFLLRVTPGGDADLGRLSDLDALAGHVAAGRLPVSLARRRLRRIVVRPPRHTDAAVMASFAVVSASAARILGGGSGEVLVSGMVGLAIGMAALSIGRRPRVAPIFGALAAAFAGIGAGAAASASVSTAPWIVTLASLIVLVPGLTLTLAMREVATGHLASGAARLTGALATFLAMGCGLALAHEVTAKLFGVGALEASPLAAGPCALWTELVAYVACAAAFVVLFQCNWRDFVWLLLGCAAAFAGARLGDLTLGPRVAPFVGALAVGVTGNLFSRLAARPAVLPMLPGLLLLVPGSLGVRSLSSLLADDIVGGMSTAFAMAFVAAAIVSGLLVANTVVAPRRAL